MIFLSWKYDIFMLFKETVSWQHSSKLISKSAKISLTLKYTYFKILEKERKRTQTSLTLYY